MIERMKSLVRDMDICVMATVSEGEPHCSLMAYITDADCREIYMVTQRQTTKYKNLSMNPSVSLLVDTREEHSGKKRPETQALTVKGVFIPLENQRKIDSVRSRLLEKHPHLKSILEAPDSEILSIRFTSFLLLDGLTDAYFEEV